MTPARPARPRLELIARHDTDHVVTSVVVLAAGDDWPYRATEWGDTLVEIEDGQLELETTTGLRQRFGAGAVLTLEGLGLRGLRSVGPGPVVLVRITRSPR